MTSAETGEDGPAQGNSSLEVEVADELRRRIAGTSVEGQKYEVLAARRGIMMRDGIYGSGGAGGDSIIGMMLGFLLEVVLSVVLNAVLEGTAENRSWKVKVYRLRGPIPRRIHAEVLPRDVVDPESRMRVLLDHYVPTPAA